MMGLLGLYFPWFMLSLKEFGVVGSDTYTWGIKDFPKCWSGSLVNVSLKKFGVVGSDTYTWGIKDFHKC